MLGKPGNATRVMAWFLCLTLLAAGGHAANREEARFLRVLLGRHDAARVAAIQSIPRDFQSRQTALPVLIDALEKLADDPRFQRADARDQPDLPGGVRMMIEFIGTFDQARSTECLVSLLDCERQSWVMATVQTLCKHQHHAALEDVVAMIDSDFFRDSYGFRFILARGLKNMKHPQAWEALAVLYDRVDGQLAHRLREEFGTVTADDFDGDAERFTLWRGAVGLTPGEQTDAGDDALAKAADILAGDAAVGGGAVGGMTLPKKSGLLPSSSAASYSREKHLKPSHYYGIEIYAKRVLFVLDRSGSMDTVIAGKTRMQRAKRELITAIEGLDQQCEFSVLVFDSDVRAWRDELVLATDANKQSAARFVEYLSAGSTTNTYAALRRSLEFDDQLEAVFLLTDGEPTTGMVVQPPVILLDILRRNEVQNLTINTIAIAVDPLMASFLRKLAEPSHGEYREVD